MERAGLFPRRFLIGKRRVAWFEREVESWLAKRGAERNVEAA
jgi:predicted DNA-binding transcriptional regulator AlpA